MNHCYSTSTKLLHRAWLLSSFMFTILIRLSFSDPRISESGLFCGKTRPPPAILSSLIPTFVKEMESLSQGITNHHFSTFHRNSTIPIYALAQCHQDLSQTDCLSCYAASRTRLPRCLPSLSGSIFLDGCFLRYDNYSFYREAVSASLGSVKCSNESVSGEEDGKFQFAKNVGLAVKNVTRKALENKGFGVEEVNGVYALAQCWQSVDKDGCRKCLEEAGKKAKGCVPKKEGRGMDAGCYLRYSTEKFYSHEVIGNPHGFSALGVTIAVVLAIIAILMLSLFAAYATYIRLLKAKEERSNLGKIAISFHKASISFKYETLEKATDYFNPSRKLGQGGAGSVFLGTLPDGQTVAVKRLIFNTRQWVDDFFNEVNLISGIQHKNLVKLLGCSIEGPESLLVYEYVPNKSLDQFLFDRNKGKRLNWKQRFDIISGTAEGLAYLHEGCHVRIIHRDIKSSNVLLDENFSPKIADFGLVRCFGSDISHLSTGIAGTVGYMAPEYLIRGQLTEKADVYSFGVLVLEIVGGKRCNTFMEDSRSLLQTVWQHYVSNRLVDSIDPSIRDDVSAQEEAPNVLQIGLLCTQASATLRPSMPQVIKMLTDRDCEIPMPSQPPYMNANLSGTESSKRSYNSTNSFASNTPTRAEAASYSSLESSTMQSSNGASRTE